MSIRTLLYFVMIAGIVLVLLSIAADLIGIGAKPGFGWHQALGVTVGVIMAAGAAWVIQKKPGASK